MEYPCVVVRFMPTVCTAYRVEFVVSEQYLPKETNRAFMLICQQPYLNGKLTAEAKKSLVEAVRDASKKSRLRMCVVFGKRQCVYVKPEGAVKESSQPPSGGIECIRFPIRPSGN